MAEALLRGVDRPRRQWRDPVHREPDALSGNRDGDTLEVGAVAACGSAVVVEDSGPRADLAGALVLSQRAEAVDVQCEDDVVVGAGVGGFGIGSCPAAHQAHGGHHHVLSQRPAVDLG